MRRIAIVGSGGSGKSVMASQLGSLLGIPVVHLDAVFWRPGWVETPRAEWRETVQQLVQGDSWIMDGNYSGTFDLRFQSADTIIFLDMPRTLCEWRVIKRYFQYRGRSRPDIAPGCPEKVDWQFLKWIWTYPRRHQAQVLNLLTQFAPNRRIYRLRSSKEVREFLTAVNRST
jgi:adenylate kinase family enzyme